MPFISRLSEYDFQILQKQPNFQLPSEPNFYDMARYLSTVYGMNLPTELAQGTLGTPTGIVPVNKPDETPIDDTKPGGIPKVPKFGVPDIPNIQSGSIYKTIFYALALGWKISDLPVPQSLKNFANKWGTKLNSLDGEKVLDVLYPLRVKAGLEDPPTKMIVNEAFDEFVEIPLEVVKPVEGQVPKEYRDSVLARENMDESAPLLNKGGPVDQSRLNELEAERVQAARKYGVGSPQYKSIDAEYQAELRKVMPPTTTEKISELKEKLKAQITEKYNTAKSNLKGRLSRVNVANLATSTAIALSLGVVLIVGIQNLKNSKTFKDVLVGIGKTFLNLLGWVDTEPIKAAEEQIQAIKDGIEDSNNELITFAKTNGGTVYKGKVYDKPAIVVGRGELVPRNIEILNPVYFFPGETIVPPTGIELRPGRAATRFLKAEDPIILSYDAPVRFNEPGSTAKKVFGVPKA